MVDSTFACHFLSKWHVFVVYHEQMQPNYYTAECIVSEISNRLLGFEGVILYYG